jgi:hypothetical protein
MRSLRLAFLVPFGIAAIAHAQTLQWGPVIDCAPENAGALRPRVVLNADGDPVVLWARSSTLGSFVAVGSDAGFGPSVRLNPEDLDLAAADWQGPALAAAGDTVIVVFKALPEDMAPCYLVRSVDGGYTWSDTLRVDPYDGLVSRFPSVSIAASGDAVVEYMQFTAGYLEPRHVVRAEMGGTFMPPAPVSAPYAPGEVCDCCTGEVVAAGDRVVALYRNAGGNIRTIWGASSADGGGTFPVGAQVDATNWNLAACPSSGPDAYLTGDSVRYVWMSGEDNGTKVYMGSAHAGTLITGVQANVHPGQMSSLQQNFPRIAGRGDTLGIVWEQAASGQRDILFAYSTTGLAGLGAPDTVNVLISGAQETPDIAYAEGAFHIVWSEPGTGQVRYRRAELSDDTGFHHELPVAGMRLRYDREEGRLYIIGITPRAVEVFDAAGRRLVAANTVIGSLPVDGLAPGCYVVRALGVDARVHCGRFVKD